MRPFFCACCSWGCNGPDARNRGQLYTDKDGNEHYLADNYEEGGANYRPNRSRSGGCCAMGHGPGFIYIHTGPTNCDVGGGGGGGDSGGAIVVVLIIVLFIIGLVQSIILSIILIQFVTRRHIHVLRKRQLAAIWRVKDRDGENVRGQTVHVQWFNLQPPPTTAQPHCPQAQNAIPMQVIPEHGLPAYPVVQQQPMQVYAPAPMQVCQTNGTLQVVQLHDAEMAPLMGPAPPQGYDTLVHQVKSLRW